MVTLKQVLYNRLGVQILLRQWPEQPEWPCSYNIIQNYGLDSNTLYGATSTSTASTVDHMHQSYLVRL